jgi:hypothetical protein
VNLFVSLVLMNGSDVAAWTKPRAVIRCDHREIALRKICVDPIEKEFMLPGPILAGRRILLSVSKENKYPEGWRLSRRCIHLPLPCRNRHNE